MTEPSIMLEMGGKASDWMSDKPLEMKQPCIGNDIGHFGCNFPGTVVLLPQPVQQEINPVVDVFDKIIRKNVSGNLIAETQGDFSGFFCTSHSDLGKKFAGQGTHTGPDFFMACQETERKTEQTAQGKTVCQTVQVTAAENSDPVKNEHMPYPYVSGFIHGVFIGALSWLLLNKIIKSAIKST